jgi:ELWxxDGT repeat protein
MDIRPGPEGSNPSDLVVWNDKLYFKADDGVHGEELWVSTGKKNETHMVTDIISVPVEQAGISEPTSFGNSIFFAHDDPDHGRELWSLTEQGGEATLVRDIAQMTP